MGEVQEGRGWGVDLGLAGCQVEGGPLALCYLPLRTGSLWEGQSLPDQQGFKAVKTSKIQKTKSTTNTHMHMQLAGGLSASHRGRHRAV